MTTTPTDITIYDQDFESCEDIASLLTGLNTAINTSYIPQGKTVEEFIDSFTQIQLSRRFSPGYDSAHLSMLFEASQLAIVYGSTSGTGVFITLGFNDEMEIETVNLAVTLPKHRIAPKRYHFESITRFLYENDCAALEEWAPGLPVPEWLAFQREGEATTQEQMDEFLEARGFVETQVYGLFKAWVNDYGDILHRSICDRGLLSLGHVEWSNISTERYPLSVLRQMLADKALQRLKDDVRAGDETDYEDYAGPEE
jgi:hypothetical protein